LFDETIEEFKNNNNLRFDLIPDADKIARKFASQTENSCSI